MFTWLYGILNGLLTGLGQDAVNGVVPALQGLFVMILTVKILYFGYMTLAGKTQAPMQDLLWEVGRLFLILAFVTNADGYLSLVTDGFQEIKKVMGGGDNGIYGKLDDFLEKITELAASAREAEDSFWTPNISGALASILVYIGGYLAVLPIGFVALLTEITLQLLLVSAPIFIFCLMYGFLKNMFAQWLQLVFSNILVVFFYSIIISFATDLIGKQITAMNSSLASNDSGALSVGFSIIGIGIFIFILSKIVLGMAQSIASVSIEQSMQSAGLNTAGSIGRGSSRAGKGTYQGGKSAYGWARNKFGKK